MGHSQHPNVSSGYDGHDNVGWASIFFNNDTLHPPNLIYILYLKSFQTERGNVKHWGWVARGTERHIIVTSHGVSNHWHLDCLLSSGAHQENIKAPCYWTPDNWYRTTSNNSDKWWVIKSIMINNIIVRATHRRKKSDRENAEPELYMILWHRRFSKNYSVRREIYSVAVYTSTFIKLWLLNIEFDWPLTRSSRRQQCCWVTSTESKKLIWGKSAGSLQL